jgi:hypothetical protein
MASSQQHRCLEFQGHWIKSVVGLFSEGLSLASWIGKDVIFNQRDGGNDRQAGERHRQPEKLATNEEGEKFCGSHLSAKVRSTGVTKTGQGGIFRIPGYYYYFINKLAL